MSELLKSLGIRQPLEAPRPQRRWNPKVKGIPEGLEDLWFGPDGELLRDPEFWRQHYERLRPRMNVT